MPITLRQKALAKAIVENAKNGTKKGIVKLSEDVGYSKESARTQTGRIVQSEGVQKELKNLGFTEDAAKKVVEEIMNNPKVDPSARLKATDQVFKIHGSYAPNKEEHSGTIEVKPITGMTFISDDNRIQNENSETD